MEAFVPTRAVAVLLHPYAIVWIGTECEALENRFARRLAHRKAYAAAEKRVKQYVPYLVSVIKSLHEKHTELAQIPLHQRKKKARPEHVIELIEDARSLTKALGKGRERGFRGLISAPVVRPKGVRKRVLNRVAAKASRRYGIAIRPSMVDWCWKSYRKRFLQPQT